MSDRADAIRLEAAARLSADEALEPVLARLRSVMAKRDLPVFHEVLVQAYLVGRQATVQDVQDEVAQVRRDRERLIARIDAREEKVLYAWIDLARSRDSLELQGVLLDVCFGGQARG